MSSIDEGIALEGAQRYSEAERIYRALINNRNDDWNVWFRLGVVLLKQQKYESSSDAFANAIRLQADFAEAWSNLGIAYLSCGRMHEGLSALRKAAELDPQRIDFLRNYGVALKNSGQNETAFAILQKSIQLDPNQAIVHYHLAQLYHEIRQFDRAESSYASALQLDPNHIPAATELSELYLRMGKLTQAISGFQYVLKLWPDFERATLGLGNALYRSGRLIEAKFSYESTIRANPNHKEAWHNLGLLYYNLPAVDTGEYPLDRAQACISKSLSIDPRFATAHHTLGNVYKNQGQIDKAIESYQRAAELDPQWSGALSSLCYATYFSRHFNAESIYRTHQQWNSRFGASTTTPSRYPNSKDLNRRLKIGYVSPDFRDHVLSLYMTPLFAHHDHNSFEIYLYSSVISPDSTTTRLRGFADHWREIARSSTETNAERIRADGIDILVDLAMHMSGSQLQVFARKPAPVQITWMAYPGTTGLTSIDYRFTDPYLDPPGMFDAYYSEESVPLPNSFWCIDPLNNSIHANPLPADNNSFITFGNLNNPCKLNTDVVRLWSRVLREIPTSRLILLSYPGAHREILLSEFRQNGVADERIEFMVPTRREKYLEYYHSIDIVLDSFPYNGHTTSIDSLWMGVPVITLVGETVVGRAGLSQLTNMGRTEWICHRSDEYVAKAVRLESDWNELRRLRTTLRSELEKSPLMDAPTYTRQVEAIYQQLWRRWCTESS